MPLRPCCRAGPRAVDGEVMGQGRQLVAAFAAAALVGGVLVGVLSAPAGALTVITVTTNADSGAGSLRQAFIDASSGGVDAGDDVQIDLPANVTIDLTGSALFYDGGTGGTHTVTLQGGGSTIHQTTATDVISVTGTALFTVNDVAITGGDNVGSTGGGIDDVGGSVAVMDSTISGNTAADGGGIAAAGTVTLTNTTL